MARGGRGAPAIAGEWQIDSIPDIYLLDRAGIVRRHVIRKPQYEAFLGEIEVLVREAELEGTRQAAERRY